MTALAAAPAVLAGIAPADRPLPAQPDDGNQWTVGDCWLSCGRAAVPVLWVGAVTVPGVVNAPMFACSACVDQLADRAWNFASRRDMAARTSARARHARPRPRRPFWRLPALDLLPKPIDA
ncbi:hypothetical protein ABZW30_29945 [Kitasatospora sp. NPDC004669]|uniref:hypothetical protein n=1 Tax=Kitasatospora sp. NPDC004669 TaxID=3154555 RepID=UPI0033A56F2C